MKGKIIVSVVSIILVVGVVIGVVVGVKKHGFGTKNQEDLSPQMKAITAICSPTDYKDLCVQTLSKTTPNGTTDLKALIHAAVLATIDSVKNTINFTKTLNSTKPMVQTVIEDCIEMLEMSAESVQTAVSLIGDGDLQSVNDHVGDLKTWIGSVLADYTSCMVGFEENDETDKDHMPEMQKNWQDPTQLADNALAILDELSNILTAFNIKLNTNPNSRRLLTTNDDEYPAWLSAADRKLMAAVDAGTIVPNATVAKTGKAFRTIKDALKAIPNNVRGRQRYVIYVKAGIYDEKVAVKVPNVFMYGDGPWKTIVTHGKSVKGLERQYKEVKTDRTSTFRTATFAVDTKWFLCKSMGFHNTAGAINHQAVALRVSGDQSAFFDCAILGFQDSLYMHKERQFYRDCFIFGTIDFIFGAAKGLIQNSQIGLRVPLPGQYNVIAASAREFKRLDSGIIIQSCRIFRTEELIKAMDQGRQKVDIYLARPWKEKALTVFMESDLGNFIKPEGYIEWVNQPPLPIYKGDYLAEFKNVGPSADTRGRVKWPSVHPDLTPAQASRWTAAQFLQDKGVQWLQRKDFPFPCTLGFAKKY